MKKTSVVTLLALLTAVFSCKKDENTPAPVVKFMSLTAGSTWSYKNTDNSNTTPVVTNYTVTATNRDTTANSKTYRVFTNNNGPNEYYNISGSDYYTFRALPASLADTSIEVLYLKDNIAVGATWTQSATINVMGYDLTLTLHNKIANKGLSKTVNGIAYSDVTEVETSLSVAGIPSFLTYTLTSDIHYFYAPRYGQIMNTTQIDFAITGLPGFTPVHFKQTTELQSATIL